MAIHPPVHPEQSFLSTPSLRVVAASPAVHVISAIAGFHHVVAVPAVQGVVAVLAVQLVVALPAVQDVVAVAVACTAGVISLLLDSSWKYACTVFFSTAKITAP